MGLHILNVFFCISHVFLFSIRVRSRRDSGVSLEWAGAEGPVTVRLAHVTGTPYSGKNFGHSSESCCICRMFVSGFLRKVRWRLSRRINETTWFNPQQNLNSASRVLSAFHFGSLKTWFFVHLFLRRLNGLTKNLLRWGGWGLVCSIGPMNLLCFFAALRGQAGSTSSRWA